MIYMIDSITITNKRIVLDGLQFYLLKILINQALCGTCYFLKHFFESFVKYHCRKNFKFKDY
jgi:hypothetical protein